MQWRIRMCRHPLRPACRHTDVTNTLHAKHVLEQVELLVRQQLLRFNERKAAAVAEAISNPCAECLQDVMRQLSGVDRARCDRHDKNLLNNLLSDTLWPQYHEWLASWLDHLIEKYVEEYGVEIDDATRTVGRKAIKLQNIWGRYGRSRTVIHVQVSNLSSFDPTLISPPTPTSHRRGPAS
jgi:hypothetical protein